jgi:hypothetical protein
MLRSLGPILDTDRIDARAVAVDLQQRISIRAARGTLQVEVAAWRPMLDNASRASWTTSVAEDASSAATS